MDQSPTAPAQPFSFKKQALISAVTTGDTETVIDLLDGGVPVDTKGNDGVSLLHRAAGGGHVSTVRLLIRKRCDVDSVDCRGLTPLHWAATNGQTMAVRELIRNGAAKSVDAGEFGTPFHQAAKKGHVETVVAMLEEGCPISTVNNVGATVLHYAAEGGHVEMVNELVVRGCDVNAVKANGCTPLHLAAAHGRTETVRELIRLGAVKYVDAGVCGTPLHSGALGGNVDTVEALLEDELCDAINMPKHDVTPSRAQESEYNLIGTCDSVGVTPIMSAVLFGQVEMFKFLASKGGDISDIDAYSLSTLEHCFIGGQASKLSQFCEACSIEGRGEGLRSALASLINQGLIDGHKVLCLCAISGDSLFLDDGFIELVARDACTMPAAVKCAKFYFFKGVPFLNQLSLPDGSSLNPLHIALLSLKCFKMGFAGKGSSIELGAKDHTVFITKLLSHPVLKETVYENFPNGLSPLDLAQQFELHHVAALIEGVGGRPGAWADIPQDFYAKHHLKLLSAYDVLNSVCKMDNGGHEAKKVFLNILGAQSVESVVHVADDSQLVEEQVLGQRPNLGNVVTYVLSRIQTRHWKRVGLALGMEKFTLDELQQQFSNDDDCYLETLSHWLEHGSSVTWKTLLDVLGHFETKHTVDELTDKIVQVLGGGHQVSVQVLCVE